MSGKRIPRLPRESTAALVQREPAGANAPGAPLIGELLMRRHWTIGVAVAGCLLAAAIYLLFARRIYTAQSRLFIEQNGQHVLNDSQNHPDSSQADSYLYSQASAILSTPVVRYALDQVGYRQLKTFSKLNGDPVEWLLQGGSFKVDVGKKDNILTVSMESPYPAEATDIVKAVVDGYLFRLSKHRRVTGEEMVKILADEREQLERKREAGIEALVRFKAENGAISFRDEKGNITLDRLASLSTALTAAELASLEFRVQLVATNAALADPQDISAFVEAQQMKGRDFGDKEFDDLRSALEQYQLTLRSSLEVIGPNNIRAREIQSTIDLLKTKIAAKEKSIAEAQLTQLRLQLAAADDREKQIRASLAEQRATAMAMNPKAAEYARLENDVERMQKQCDVLDSRVQEVSVNNLNAGALDVEVMDPAHADEDPIRPRKSLTLSIALLAGLMLGTSVVMVQEWRDKRLRTPEEVAELLQMPMVGIVPRMPPELSPPDRAKIVHEDSMSEVAEAYRGIRTTISFGTSPSTKTLLVTSPTSGEGKSTCSSNLAISLAQGGHRTLLIDADMRRPVQDKIFELPPGPGLADVMTGKAKLRDVIRATAIDDLYLLPCGTIPGKPAEMLESKRFAQVMATLSAAFDRVVIDSPPVIAVTDARILAASADVTLLVIRMHRSSWKLGATALDALQKVKARVLGAIANEVQTGDAYGYYGRQRSRVSSGNQFLRMFGSALGHHGGAVNGNGNGNGNGKVNGNGSAGRLSLTSMVATQLPAEILEINDPESPADTRWELPAHR